LVPNGEIQVTRTKFQRMMSSFDPFKEVPEVHHSASYLSHIRAAVVMRRIADIFPFISYSLERNAKIDNA